MMTVEQVLELLRQKKEWYDSAQFSTYEPREYYERMAAKADAIDEAIGDIMWALKAEHAENK